MATPAVGIFAAAAGLILTSTWILAPTPDCWNATPELETATQSFVWREDLRDKLAPKHIPQGGGGGGAGTFTSSTNGGPPDGPRACSVTDSGSYEGNDTQCSTRTGGGDCSARGATGNPPPFEGNGSACSTQSMVVEGSGSGNGGFCSADGDGGHPEYKCSVIPAEGGGNPTADADCSSNGDHENGDNSTRCSAANYSGGSDGGNTKTDCSVFAAGLPGNMHNVCTAMGSDNMPGGGPATRCSTWGQYARCSVKRNLANAGCTSKWTNPMCNINTSKASCSVQLLGECSIIEADGHVTPPDGDNYCDGDGNGDY